MRAQSLIGLVGAALWLSQAPLLYAEPHSLIRAGVSYNDNLSYASAGEDVVGDTITTLDYTRAYPRPGAGNGTLSYLFNAGVELYAQYDDLNTIRGEAGVLYEKGANTRPAASWYQLGASLGYQMVSDALRDALLMELNLKLGKRLDEHSGVELGLGYRRQDASDKTFDGEVFSLGLGADYRLNPRGLLFIALTRYFGEVVVTATPTTQLASHSGRSIIDGVYGKGRVAYSLDDQADVIELGGQYGLGDNSALELIVSRRESSGGDTGDYSANLYSLNYLYRY